MTLHLSFPSMYKSRCQGIKVPFENKVMGLAHRSLVSPCHSFFPFLFFSLCSSFRMTPWGTGALWIHFFAWVSKTQSGRCPASSPGRGCPVSSSHQEGACGLREQSKLYARSFIGFLCKPRKIKPLSLPFFYFPYHRCRHPEGTPGSCWGWTPAHKYWEGCINLFNADFSILLSNYCTVYTVEDNGAYIFRINLTFRWIFPFSLHP